MASVIGGLKRIDSRFGRSSAYWPCDVALVPTSGLVTVCSNVPRIVLTLADAAPQWPNLREALHDRSYTPAAAGVPGVGATSRPIALVIALSSVTRRAN